MGADEWIDSSKAETFKLCPQKYAYRFEEHLVPIDRKRDSPIMFGGAIHRALETLYRGSAFIPAPCPLGPCQRCKGEPIPTMSAVFLAHYTDDPDDPREIRTVDRGLDLLAQYLGKWRREPFDVLAVEVPFELEYQPSDWIGLTFKYIGRIDLVVEQDGTLMTVDHKTTTRFGMVFDTSFKLSGQFTGYMKGASKLLNREVHIALANAMRITTKIDDSSFARIYTHRTPEEFDRWEREVQHVMQQILTMRESGFWPRSAPYACGAFNRVCEYYSLCISSAQTRETLKQSAYERVVWEPRRSAEEQTS
jgi:PD-(D/E)XK nuclease superfamily